MATGCINTINRTNYYLIIPDTTEKDKNICNIVGPWPPSRRLDPGSLY